MGWLYLAMGELCGIGSQAFNCYWEGASTIMCAFLGHGPGNWPSDLSNYDPPMEPPIVPFHPGNQAAVDTHIVAPCLQMIKEPIDKYHSPLPPPKKKRKTQHHQAIKGSSRVINYMPCLQLSKWRNFYMKKGGFIQWVLFDKALYEFRCWVGSPGETGY